MSVSLKAAGWIRKAALVTLALIAAFALYVYVASERVLRRTYDVPLVDIPVPNDSAAIAEGARLAAIHGCTGCHGSDLEGYVWDDDLLYGYRTAPDLTRVAQEYSSAELIRVIRRGVRPNGESVRSMPSDMFYHLSDRDVALIAAFLRTAPPADGLAYAFRPGPATRLYLALSREEGLAAKVLEMGPRMTVAPGDTLVLGEYLATTSCTECHGSQLEGDWGPDLAIVEAYSRDDFTKFLETGIATGDRELPVMSGVARGRFSHLTDEESDALYAYLIQRARQTGAR